MKYRVITITREFGSGGRTIGKALGEKLGYDVYDYEFVKKMTMESGLEEDYIKEYGEDANKKNLFSFMWTNAGGSVSDQLFIAQREAITNLANKGNCIIVGRCADYILKDREDVFHVFIHADMDFRAERIVNKYGERTDSPEKRIKDKDKRRKAYYRYYTNYKWGDATNYHMSLNSGKLGIDHCVDLIMKGMDDTL
jgi:cytidylate kinase